MQVVAVGKVPLAIEPVHTSAVPTSFFQKPPLHALTALFKSVVQVYSALGAALTTVVQSGSGTTQLRGLVREAQ